MSEFFRFLIDPLMVMTMLVGMVIGALAARSLCQRGALPNETAWQLAAYGGGSLLGGLLLGFLAFLYFQIPGGQGPGVLDWLFLLLLIGAAVGAWGGGVLGKRRLSPEKALWQIVAYGGGMLLGGLLGFLLMLLLTLTSPGGPAVPSTMPTPTPTATLPGATATATPTTLKPTATATPTTLKPTATPTTPPNKATAILTPTLTPTPTGIPPLPANFSLTLSATGESVCGYPDFQAPYDVTIEYDAMTLFQVDAGITTTGAYDPATGAFNTSVSGVPGIPGTEIYDGAITFDGTTITMAGTYTYVDDPNYCEGEWTIFGETTP